MLQWPVLSLLKGERGAKGGDEARLAFKEIDMVRGRTLLSGYGTLFMEGVEKCC
jgi:hypothetical protein